MPKACSSWLLAILIFAFADLALGINRPSVLVPEQRNSGWHLLPAESKPKPPVLRSMVSQRNLLGLTRDTPFGPAKTKNGVPVSLATEAETLRVLVLKIEFRTEAPDDPTTTGNGNFDLRSFEQFYQEEGHFFDPSPHNTSYFSAHMEALRRYWYFVSDGRLRLIWEVYPQQESVALRLPYPMSYYGSGGNPDSILPGLERFFTQSILLADSLLPQLRFSRYHSVILFHAGSDQQNNLSFVEDTPNDLWTGFIFLGEPISVDSGRSQVQEGLIMPETACQDNRITCLNAVLAHEFGHQLGLVDIYSTQNFMTQVGDFSLMDNNGLSVALDFGAGGRFVTGTMPVYPDAWSRAYLGFSGVVDVEDATDVAITAAEQNYHSNEIVRVPISQYEYFLLENRQVNADFSYLDYNPSIPNALLADPLTGVVLGPGYAYIVGHDTIKVPTGEYDRLLPGSGMLIWHVDEAVAYMNYTGQTGNNFSLNTLQWDPYRRFLSLVEADGVIDFGGNYYTGFGTAAEFFRQGHNSAITPFSNPSTRSNLGADSHIWITGISASDTLMRCGRISCDWRYPGFPVMGFPYLGSTLPLRAFDLDGDGGLEVVTGGGRFLVVVRQDGLPYMGSGRRLMMQRYDGDTVLLAWPVFAQLDTTIGADLVAGNFAGDDSLEIACCDRANRLYFFSGLDGPVIDSLADPIATLPLPGPITCGPVAFDVDGDTRSEVVLGLHDGRIMMVRLMGPGAAASNMLDSLKPSPVAVVVAENSLFALTSDSLTNSIYVATRAETVVSDGRWIPLPSGRARGLAAADLDRDQHPDAVVAVGDYLYLLDGASSALTEVAVAGVSSPACGDINNDGFPEVLCLGFRQRPRLYAFNHQGVILTGFPVALDQREMFPENIEPLVADLDGNGWPDILVGLPQGGLDAYDWRGQRLPGFPLPTSSRLFAPPLAGDLNGDGKVEVVAIDSTGFIHVWATGAIMDVQNFPWPTKHASYSGNPYLLPTFNKPINFPDGFLAKKDVYCYPNPATDRVAFRYYTDRAADITVRIFDYMGELVQELRGVTSGGVSGEIWWDCSRQTSGVYFARVAAKAAGISKDVIVKVALVR